MPITPLPPAPTRVGSTPSEFNNAAELWSAALDPWTTEVNATASQINDDATSAEEAAATATGAASVANFQGDWLVNDVYDLADSVLYQGVYWVSRQAGNTGNTPMGGSAFWQKIETTAVSVNAAGLDLDWSTEDVLKYSATGDFAITFSNVPVSGVAFVEIKGGGDWTPTYPAEVVWNGGEEPPLATGTDSTVLVFYTSTAGAVIGGGTMLGVVAL